MLCFGPLSDTLGKSVTSVVDNACLYRCVPHEVMEHRRGWTNVHGRVGGDGCGDIYPAQNNRPRGDVDSDGIGRELRLDLFMV